MCENEDDKDDNDGINAVVPKRETGAGIEAASSILASRSVEVSSSFADGVARSNDAPEAVDENEVDKAADEDEERADDADSVRVPPNELKDVCAAEEAATPALLLL